MRDRMSDLAGFDPLLEWLADGHFVVLCVHERQEDFAAARLRQILDARSLDELVPAALGAEPVP